MEKIVSIEYGEFGYPTEWNKYEGIIINTSEQVILLGIACGQMCCERFGYFMSEDDASEFIGAELKDISIVDVCLDIHKLKEESGGMRVYDNEPETMFVNLQTDKGLLQFVAYNAHNGYYGHIAIVVSKQLTESEKL